jgi:hypothetical protein
VSGRGRGSVSHPWGRGRGVGDYATSASLPLIQADDVDVKFPCARHEA